jgi:hypothetical protein
MSGSSLAVILSYVAAATLAAIGILAVLLPRSLAHSYGIPVRDETTRAYVRATGVRDLAFAAVLFAVAWRHDPLALAVAAGAGLLISLADFYIAFVANGRALGSELLAHVGGAVGFAVILALVLRDLQR